jgi:hypothetical protein
MIGIEKQIAEHINQAKGGSLFYPADFERYGSTEAINVALHRLAKRKLIKRLAFGIYAKPTISKLIGEVYPTTEEVAKAIARRDNARLLPTGAYAQHKLGLSTQVPMKLVLLTDGPARTVKLGKSTILFKRASPKKMAMKGEISKLVVMALSDIGKDKLTNEEEIQILNMLTKEKPELIKNDIRLAPRWIGEIMAKALK